MTATSRVLGLAIVCVLPVLTGCRTLPGREDLGRAHQPYLLFADGQARCRLVLPAEPEQEERQAAELIRDTFRDMGGAEPTIVAEPVAAPDSVDIHIGATALARWSAMLPPGLDLDGFVIQPHDARHILLRGARPVSTFYAATEFLERYAGALWVWPGEHGTVLPKTDRLEVTVRRQVSEPAFRSRKFSGIRNAKMAYYRIHQTGRETRSNFHHNVWPVLKEELHDTHPQYFSLVNGERRRPTPNKSNWQACTSNPDVVRVFADAAKRQFRTAPWISAFSVSQNDGHGFCECEACRALDLPGVDGISDRYFTFVNDVADAVRDEFPDKFISCLAYGKKGTRDVPLYVTLRPNTLIYAVVPTLRHHHDVIVEWSKAAPNLGVYFWIHGKAVPKFYPRRWARYLRFLRRHKVREVYAEVYQDNPDRQASWALDGPRVWITAKLLWNPDASVDELMARFCSRFYGPARAQMRQYYRRCEQAWERRADPFDFGKKWTDLEFDLYDTEDMDVMEECLRQAMELARGDPEVTARLAALRTALTPVAVHVRHLDLVNILAAHPLSSRTDATDLIATVHEVERASRELAREGHVLFGALPHETESAVDAQFGRITQLLGDGALAFWQDQASARPELQRFVAPQVLDIRGELRNIAANPSFEEQRPSDGEADAKLNWQALNAPGWSQWLRPGTRGQVGVATDTARTGSNSLVLTGVEAACGIYTQAAEPGERYRVRCWVKTSVRPEAGQERTGGTLTMKWQTADGKWLSAIPERRVALPAGTASWTPLLGLVTIPDGVGRLVVLLGAKDQALEEQTWFDDLCLEKLCEAP